MSRDPSHERIPGKLPGRSECAAAADRDKRFVLSISTFIILAGIVRFPLVQPTPYSILVASGAAYPGSANEVRDSSYLSHANNAVPGALCHQAIDVFAYT